jgi:hypothetical protein
MVGLVPTIHEHRGRSVFMDPRDEPEDDDAKKKLRD